MLFDNFLNIFILLMPYFVGFFVGGDHVMVNCKACIWNEWRRCGKLFCIRPRCPYRRIPIRRPPKRDVYHV